MAAEKVARGARALALVITLGSALAACAAETETADDAGERDGGACDPTTCDDDLYCNGIETCADGVCTAGTPPCAPDRCDESRDACDACDDDLDGDGHVSEECGGDDCDDGDRNRYPGNDEICDDDDHDEDCRATTYGVVDEDDDGAPDARCCNVDAEGVRYCGDDCDDARAGVSPEVPEVCNRRDDDCDGLVDEELLVMLWPDADGDLYGDASAAPTMGCPGTPELATNGDDCDDTEVLVNPGAAEICDANTPPVDENCDGAANPAERCACTGSGTRSCPLPGACASGNETCTDGAWSACSIAPVDERCNGLDDDCDGMTDETFTMLGAACDGGDADQCAEGTYACSAATGGLTCTDLSSDTLETCNAGDDDCDGMVDEGFSRWCDRPGGVTARTLCADPGERVCDGVDDNCDGATDEGLTTRHYLDADGDGHGLASSWMDTCAPSGQYTATLAGDCDDSRATTFPGATEICNNLDDDCSSGGGAITTEDADGDGYSPTAAACLGGYQKTDCNDGVASVNPGADYMEAPRCAPVMGGGGTVMRTQWCDAANCCSWQCSPSLLSCVPSSALWDYDCSGTVDREPRVSGGCSYSPISRTCLGSGPMYDDASPPACGTDVTYRTCERTPTGCQATTSTRPLRCR